MEMDTDRMGSDYQGFPVANADPAACKSACDSQAQCQSWTFVKPGIKGPQAMCYLKNATPASIRNTCCVSGVKQMVRSSLNPMLKRR